MLAANRHLDTVGERFRIVPRILPTDNNAPQRHGVVCRMDNKAYLH